MTDMTKTAVQRMRILVLDTQDKYKQLEALINQTVNPGEYVLENIDDPARAEALLGKGGADIVLAEFSLSQNPGEMISRLHTAAPEIPIIVVADFKDEATALEAVGKGAQDYLVRADLNPRMLARVMRYAIERRRADLALLKAKQKNEQLLASITSILIRLDADGRVTFWNRNAAQTLGVQVPAVLNRHLKECEIGWEAGVVLKSVDEARTRKEPVRLDNLRFSRPDGYEGFLGFTIIPMKGEADEFAEYLLFGANITERKKLEELKGEFVSTVSHELRTPMTIIREGVSQVMEGILGSITDEQKVFLNMSLEAIDRLTRIINDLLDMSKIESGKVDLKRSRIDLAKLVDETVESFKIRAESKGLKLKTRLFNPKIEIYADRDKIIQVFTNLIFNSLKFTDQGHIETTVELKDGLLECSVIDTGRGISKEDLQRVFGKFQQFGRTDGPGDKGTGLGLAISKGIVELHGGRVGLESKLGEGTRFWFTLPVYTEAQILRETLYQTARDAEKKKSGFSVLTFVAPKREKLIELFGREKASVMLHGLDQAFKGKIKHPPTLHLRDDLRLVVQVLVEKSEAAPLEGAIRQHFEAEWVRSGIGPPGDYDIQILGLPHDAADTDALFEKLNDLT